MSEPRLQGTDGVRGLAAAADHPLASGMDPRKAYLERGVFTEEFAELYAFAAAKWLLESASEGIISPNAIVVAWDPRDTEGRFYGAIVRAVVRAGARALVTGVLPTPAAAVYMASVGAAGAVVLTASHNPADQNGIKIFLGLGAMKPLPADDEALSARVWETAREETASAAGAGECSDTAAEARAVYSDYIRQLPNCWLGGADIEGWDLSLDTAGGAWSGFALEILDELVPGCAAEAGYYANGRVNEGGGVVALEGRSEVGGSEVEIIRGHAGLRRLFEAGRARAADLRAGRGFAVCGVFDADGDRAYTLVYDPFNDSAHVLGGDGAIVLQARFLKAEEELPAGAVAAVTIESDVGAATALSELGLDVRFLPVGDKWILHAASDPADIFALGGEESGHTIVPGRLSDAYGASRLLAVGDGFKSFLNTCASIHRLSQGKESQKVYAELAEPFPRGFKKTLYGFHVDRRLFSPRTKAWEAARTALEAAARGFSAGVVSRWAPLDDDPSVLYLALEEPGGCPRASIFVRNSGTERKTGVTLRGPMEWKAQLLSAGEAAVREILIHIKDRSDPNTLAEEAALRGLEGGPVSAEAFEDMLEKIPESELGSEISPGRIRKEAIRGGLVSSEGGRLNLTGLGRWYLENGK
ncbi:MAG: hypothetical protein QF787_02765 [Nitrospinota bacterium]|jgi:phosphoglucosamine mutase|nr:hypothetical protein [Nitrospinota bacterium]